MSGFKLYEISEELMTLEDMLYDDTVDQETVQDTLEMINMDFEDKADNYAKIIRTMDASIKALKDEEQRLSGRRKALEERQKWPPIPDNMKIRKLLEEQPVEWAHLEPRGESLRIR